MDFDWTKPMKIDWSGKSGPLFTEHALENCVIKRIINNTYCAPFCEKKYIRAVPKWNPRDLLEKGMHGWNDHAPYRRFVPGELPLPAYPQVSTLNQIQQQQGVRVLSTQYENVQPHQYARPSKMDHLVFQEIKELYETEQQQYLKWAKLLWLNGDCIQALRPKPIIEQVYEAEFKMRAHEVKSWPQNFVLAAQIPLENNNDSFELEHKANLLNVNVQDLPIADYPKVMEEPLSILLDTCPTPEPCIEHICKFMLPHEDSMSSLPLSEIHRELANFANSHDCSVIASENALHCLLETDRKWHIPVSVIQVVSPEYGDTRTVVVLGNEFAIQKTCAAQRTYRAYKHLLRETFAPSKAQHDHQQNTNAKTVKPVNDTKIKVSNKENDFNKQLVDRSESDRMVDETTEKQPEINNVNDLHEYNFNESDDDFSSDTERLIIADPVEHHQNANTKTAKPVNVTKIKVTNKDDDFDKQLVDRSEPNTLLVDETTDKHPEINNVDDDHHDYNFNESDDDFSSDNERLIIADPIETISEPSGRHDASDPKNSNNEFATPGYGHLDHSRELYSPPSTSKNVKPTLCDTNEDANTTLLEAIKNTTSKSDKANKNVDTKCLDTVSKCNEANQGISPIFIELDKNTASKSNEANKGVAPKLIEMDKNTASKSDLADNDVDPTLIEMNKNTATKSDEANHGDAPRLIEMDKDLSPKLKANDVTPILLETNIDHTSPATKLETNAGACSYKPATGKVSNSPTEHIPHIKPSLLVTQTSEPTNSNLLMARDTNTSEVSGQKAVSKESVIKRKLSDSGSPLTTGLANSSGNELTSREPVSGPSAGKRVRSLLDRVYLEHNYFQSIPKTLESTKRRLLSVKDSQVSIDETDSDQSSPGDNRIIDYIDSIPKLDERKPSYNTPAVSKIKTTNATLPNAADHKPVQNVEYNKLESSGKSKPWKISFSELFGDDSDGEEPDPNTSDRFNNAKEKKIANATHDHKKHVSSEHKAKPTDNILDSYKTIRKITKTYSRKISLSDPLSEQSIEKSPLKPCLRNSRFNRPANLPAGRLPRRSKTKLSDTKASASEYCSSISGSDSEEVILGFNNDVAVPTARRQKISKKPKIKKCQRNTFSRIHNRRSSKKPKYETKPKNKKVPTKSNEKNSVARSGWNSCATADESDNSITDTKRNVAPKRSRRLSTRLQTDESDDPHKTKKNKQKATNSNNVAPRRSQRLTTRLQPEESGDPHKKKTNGQKDTKTKIVALRRSRRLSTRLQEEQSEDPPKKKTNNQKDTVTKNVALRRSRRLSTRSQEESKTNKSIEEVSLNLSERTKRYLRRSLNFESSDTDEESGKEMTEGTKKYPRGSTLSACSSDAEMNIFHFTKTNDTDSDDSDSDNSLTIDCPELHSTEERQVRDVSGETRETEKMVTSRIESHSVSGQTSSTPPVTLRPQVEVKQVDATRTLYDTLDHIRTNEGRDRKLSSSEQLLLQNETLKNPNTLPKEAFYDVIGVNSCTCKGTKFDVPPPRSFKKWQLKNKTSNGAFDIIVHSSHKVRKGENEVLLEPIVEFQPDLGGTRQSESKIRALTLSLMMRPLAQLVNVRVNHESGEVIVIEELNGEQLSAQRGDARPALAGALHAALGQLRYLLPGAYVLAHDMSHGANAMLYTTKGLSAVHERGSGAQTLGLRCDNINMPDAEEAIYANTPPDLAPVLLPYHKSRGMLPLAFTPKKKEVKAAKKITAALAKVKLPPHGIKWPKKKKKKPRKPRQNRQPQAYHEPEI